MNEKQKNTILVGFIILLFVLIIIQSIADCSTIRRADIKIDNLERELADAGRRVENCTRELEDSRGTSATLQLEELQITLQDSQQNCQQLSQTLRQSEKKLKIWKTLSISFISSTILTTTILIITRSN